VADRTGTKPTDDIVREALTRFEQSVEGSEFNREKYYEDTKFARLADQWPAAIKKQRVQEGRPALVVNKLPAFIRAVVNESRQNKPSVRVSPVDNGADEEHAEVIGGIIRSIERNSHAELAYDTAIDHAVTGGFGFFRVEIDYAHEMSFEMEAKITRIPNALMVHWDTSSTSYDASDWEFAFISEMIPNKEFRRRYPDAALVNFEGDDRLDTGEDWLGEDQTRVAEYFLRTKEKYKLVQLAMPNPQTGEVDLNAVREEDLGPMALQFFQAGEMEVPEADEEAAVVAWMQATGVEMKQEREADRWKVTRRIISGAEVLETNEWPGRYIPICPVWGDEIFIDGIRYFRSMIADAKDPQQMFNFWRSSSTELVALAPRTPWVGPKGFVPKGDEAKWESANTRAHAYLEYEKTSGEPPRRQEFAGVPTGVVHEAANNIDDMKSIMGIFDSSLGARSNEVSGRAIMARERQGDVSNFHFIDNLNRAIRWCGQILVDIIPSVYSARHSIRILGEDQKANVISLTQDTGGMAASPGEGMSGDQKLYNISIGKYDVDVKSGPSYATQREETRETLIEIMRQVPDAAPFIGDVLLDHMDFVGADKVAKRLKSILPEEVRMSEESAEQSDDPEKAALQVQVQNQQKQMQQAQEAVTQQMQKLQQENEAIKADRSAEMARTQTEENKARGSFENETRKLDQADLKLALEERALKMQEDEYAYKSRKPSTEEQWDYDRLVEQGKQEYEAQQKALDRQADLAKAIISKQVINGQDLAAAVVINEANEAAIELLDSASTDTEPTSGY